MSFRCFPGVVIGAGVLVAGSVASGSIISYDNTPNSTFSNAVLSNNEWADDLHMTTAGPLAQFTFEYINNTSSTANVRFYENNATNTLLPGAGTLIAEFLNLAIGGSSGTKTVGVAPASGIVLPQHVWMSVEFPNGAQMNLHNPPAVGSSSSAVSVAPAFDNFNFDWGGNFPFRVEVTPAPGVGTLLGVAGLVALRRRR